MGTWQDFINRLLGSKEKSQGEKKINDEVRKAYPSFDVDFANASLRELFSSGRLKSVSYDEKTSSFAQMQMYLSDNSCVTLFPKTGAWRRLFPNGSILVHYPDGSGFFEEKSDKTKMVRHAIDKDGNFTEKPLYGNKTPVQIGSHKLHAISKAEGKKCVSGVEYPDGSAEYTFEDGSRLVNTQTGTYGYYETRYKKGSEEPVSGPSWYELSQAIDSDIKMQTGGENVNSASKLEWEKWQKHIDEQFTPALVEKLHKKWTHDYNTSNEATKLKSIVYKRTGTDGTLHLDVNVCAEWQTKRSCQDKRSGSYSWYDETAVGPLRTRDATLDKSGDFKVYAPLKKPFSQTSRKISVDVNFNAGPQMSFSHNNAGRPRAKTLGGQ